MERASDEPQSILPTFATTHTLVTATLGLGHPQLILIPSYPSASSNLAASSILYLLLPPNCAMIGCSLLSNLNGIRKPMLRSTGLSWSEIANGSAFRRQTFQNRVWRACSLILQYIVDN